MIRRGTKYTLVSALLSLVVAAAGVWVAGDEGRAEVLGATALAWGYQVAVFWAVFLAAELPPLISYLVSFVARLILLGFVAFLVVPIVGWDAEPTLLTLVAVLFVTTLLEPVFLRTVPFTKR